MSSNVAGIEALNEYYVAWGSTIILVVCLFVVISLILLMFARYNRER